MIQKILSHYKKKGKRDTSHIAKKRKQLQIGSFLPKRRKRILGTMFQKILSPLKNIQSISIILGAFFVFLCSFLFVMFGPIFNVKQIFITREDTIININKAYSSIEHIRGDNILSIDTNQLAERLQKGQDSIQSIKFNISFPDTLNIHLKSYTPIFKSSEYLLLTNGAIIKNISGVFNNIPELFLSHDINEFSVFKKRLSSIELSNIQDLLEELSKNIIGFSPQSLQYFIDEKELLLMSTSGSIFIFDLNEDIYRQVRQLAIFQQEGGDILEKKYIYIDVRINKKLFLCDYEKEFHCKNNLKMIYGSTVFENFLTGASQSPQ